MGLSTSSLIDIDVDCATRIIKWDGVRDVSAEIEGSAVVYMDRAPEAWGVDWRLLQSSRDPRHRKFDTPLRQSKTPPAARKEVGRCNDELTSLARAMCPDYELVDRRGGFRPMLTGPEPLHFDTWDDGGMVAITIAMNYDDEPRDWSVSHTLDYLIASAPQVMRSLAGQKGSVSPKIRSMTMKNQGPLPDNGPQHRCQFAPGAVWACNSKTVAHAIRKGGGACIQTLFAANVDRSASHTGKLERLCNLSA